MELNFSHFQSIANEKKIYFQYESHFQEIYSNEESKNFDD